MSSESAKCHRYALETIQMLTACIRLMKCKGYGAIHDTASDSVRCQSDERRLHYVWWLKNVHDQWVGRVPNLSLLRINGFQNIGLKLIVLRILRLTAMFISSLLLLELSHNENTILS